MSIVKVKNSNGIDGFVGIENWADPSIHTMDFQVAENGIDKYGEKIFAGDTFVEYRDDLEYVGVEKL